MLYDFLIGGMLSAALVPILSDYARFRSQTETDTAEVAASPSKEVQVGPNPDLVRLVGAFAQPCGSDFIRADSLDGCFFAAGCQLAGRRLRRIRPDIVATDSQAAPPDGAGCLVCIDGRSADCGSVCAPTIQYARAGLCRLQPGNRSGGSAPGPGALALRVWP